MSYGLFRGIPMKRLVGALAHPARRLAEVPPGARWFALRAWLAVPVVEGSLRALGLRRTLRWIEWIPSRGSSPTRLEVQEGGRLVRSAYRRHPLGGQCLSQAAVQYLLHRRDGVPARFVVGVRRE